MIVRHVSATGAAAALSLMLASCATVVGGTSQEIAIDTDPQDAKCVVARGNEGAIGTVQTPGKLIVQRRKDALQITCARHGFDATTEIVASKIRGATLGNALLGGLIGVAVDASSGANNDYPERIAIVLTPDLFANADARDAHFSKITDRIKQSAAQEIKLIHDRCNPSQREFCQLDIKRIEEVRDEALARIEQRRATAKIAQARA